MEKERKREGDRERERRKYILSEEMTTDRDGERDVTFLEEINDQRQSERETLGVRQCRGGGGGGGEERERKMAGWRKKERERER